ncbi:ribosome-assembly protein 3-domain-containing protein [Biscogniauxia marginata]|nr:ribosome-assembly protein 3-domain-containing protein [Biscogniauxia marginata]
MSGKDDKTSADFTSYYLQQSTKEFAEDLDKIRSADDFKSDALPMLVKSLQQGTSMFSAADQKRILDARKRRAENEAAGDRQEEGKGEDEEEEE